MRAIEKIYWTLCNKKHKLDKSVHKLKAIGIEITSQCNLSCQHCYMSAQKEFNSNELTSDEWINFFTNLKKDFGNKILIQITGGEPLVKKDFFKILRHLNKLEFRATVCTNGVLLNDDKINKLNKYANSVSISLDGLKNTHNRYRSGDVFDTTINNIKKIKQIPNNYLAIKTTAHKNNLTELETLYKKIKKLGVDEWDLSPIELSGRANDNKNLLLNKDEYHNLCNFVDKIKIEK